MRDRVQPAGGSAYASPPRPVTRACRRDPTCMRKLALTLTAALVVGGCTSETGGVQDAVQIAAKSPALPSSPLSTQAKRITSFASMPDRGALLSFERLEQPVRRKAYTYHAVNLSEAHALRAAHPGGAIEVPTPSGKTLRIAYERHEESLDGNWTWIGRTADGLDAIITFGEKAVFGRIAQPGTEALRLTMSGGRAWMVEIDPGKVLDGNLLGGADDTGMLVPPKTIEAAVANKRAKAMTTAAGEKAGPAETIDLVIGYTSGFVTENNGEALSRLAYMVAVANQAYQASQITGRLRLVHTLQVSYTDSNSNEAALQALTGQTCNPTCSPTTVPAELVPLRTARDTYGGDLVSLVRGFQAPQHQGCGIAWLLGGGGFTIDNTDAPFGYSVVSDGNDDDETDGRNYFCNETTLAHELGHNMGQQHNVEDSGGDSGTHSYSYGYREATTFGFYTIMAYRLSNSTQSVILHFGNPNVNYSGRPTGTATADNARSMNISMPLVAQFRAPVVPFGGKIHNDFNGDGKSDIVLWNPSVSYLAYWIMNGSVYTSSSGFGLASGYAPASTGFATQISRASLLARNNTSQQLSAYIWNGSAHAQNIVGGAPAGWNAIGQGDINGDGKDDLMWRNPTTGQFAYWLMNGAIFVSGQTYSPPATYVVAGIADFNGDGRDDLLWNDPGTRNASVWLSTGTGFTVAQIGQYGTTWNMVGTGDVTGDGKADIILRDNAKVYLAYWRMDGAVYQGAAAYGMPSDREFFTNGDFNGDGFGDLVITRASDRMLWLWSSNGTAFTQANIGQYGADWTVIR